METTRKRNLDNLLQELVQAEIRSPVSPPVPAEEAWKQLQRRLHGHNRSLRTRLQGQIKPLIAAAVVLAVLITTWLPQEGFAFGRLTEIFHRVEGSVLQLFVKTGNPQPKRGDEPLLDAPSAAHEFAVVPGSEVTSRTMSLEQAQQAAAFSIRVPQAVPAPFTFRNVTVLQKRDEKSRDIYLHYQGSQRQFSIYEKWAPPNFGAGAYADRNDTVLENVTVHGQKAALLTYKNGVKKLIWVSQDIYFEIEGQLTRQEILQIAESL